MAYDNDYGSPDEGEDEEAVAETKSDRSSFRIIDLPAMDNVADILDEERLNEIGGRVFDEFVIDCDSREEKVSEWDAASKAFKMARDKKSYPFVNASNVKFPVLLEAAIQFSSRATPALLHDGKVAKGKVEGSDAQGQKAAKADRVAAYLNYQILTKNTAWQAQNEKAMLQAPIYGNAFKKVYRDPVKGTTSDLISCYQFVINACYPDIPTAPRYSYEYDLYPYQIEERKRDGRFLKVALQPDSNPEKQGEERQQQEYDGNDPSTPHGFIEQYRREDLDEDGYDEPYFVTIHKNSKKVVRMVTAFDVEDIYVKTLDGVVSAKRLPSDMVTDYEIQRIEKGPDNTYINYEFIPDPSGHAYGIGFGKLLNDLAETINTTVNQILDAGNLQNAGGGFIGREFRLKSGVIKQEPGVWQQVPFAGDDIRKAMVAFEHQGPSAVLFNVLGLLQEWTKKVTSTSEVLAGEATPNQPATTTLALIEQGLKVFTGIIGRMLRALGEELRAYFALNARHAPEEQQAYMTLGDEQAYISRQDFNLESCDVVPVADATVVTEAQAMARAEMIVQLLGTPLGGLLDPVEVLRRYFEAARIPVGNLIKKDLGPDPMQVEMMMAQLGELKAKIEKLRSEAIKNVAQAENEGSDVETKREEMAIDIQGKVMDHQMKREEHVMDLQMKREDHELDREIKQEEHAIDRRFKVADAAVTLDLKAKQGEAALKQQDAMAKQKAKQAAKGKPSGGAGK